MRLLPLLAAALGCAVAAADPAPSVNHQDPAHWKDWDESTDYAQMRFLHAASDAYNPREEEGTETDLVAAATTYWDLGKPDKAFEMLDQLFDSNPVSILGHLWAVLWLRDRVSKEHDPAKAAELKVEEHRQEVIKDGLVNSILRSGDGKSYKTAYKVICLPEELAVIYNKQMKPIEKTSPSHMQKIDGLLYSVQSAFNPKTGQPETLYFDVSKGYHPSPAPSTP